MAKTYTYKRYARFETGTNVTLVWTNVTQSKCYTCVEKCYRIKSHTCGDKGYTEATITLVWTNLQGQRLHLCGQTYRDKGYTCVDNRGAGLGTSHLRRTLLYQRSPCSSLSHKSCSLLSHTLCSSLSYTVCSSLSHTVCSSLSHALYS